MALIFRPGVSISGESAAADADRAVREVEGDHIRIIRYERIGKSKKQIDEVKFASYGFNEHMKLGSGYDVGAAGCVLETKMSGEYTTRSGTRAATASLAIGAAPRPLTYFVASGLRH
jgi:hypothetical protein